MPEVLNNTSRSRRFQTKKPEQNRRCAASDAGTKIYYYVLEGPAEVDGDVLKFTQIPPRAKFPVRVTVVAWQHGLPGKIKSATPVARAFLIN